MDESSRVSLARSLCHSDTGRGQDNFIQSISNFFALQEGRGRGEGRYRQAVLGSMCWDHPRDLNIFPINFNSFSSFSLEASVDVASAVPSPHPLLECASACASACCWAVCLYLLDLNSQPHFHVRLSVFAWCGRAWFQFDLLSLCSAFCARELKLNRICHKLAINFNSE